MSGLHIIYQKIKNIIYYPLPKNWRYLLSLTISTQENFMEDEKLRKVRKQVYHSVYTCYKSELYKISSLLSDHKAILCHYILLNINKLAYIMISKIN